MPHSNISIFVPHVGCPHKCSFCNQNSITGVRDIPRAADVKRILDKAVLEIEDKENAEIAFFGGSFTAIPREYMNELLSAAKDYIGHGMFKGIRISTRPDCIDGKILSDLKAFGVTAIELGVQSTDDGVLLKNGRGHSSECVFKSAALIRNSGFNLGLQMMVGMYSSTRLLDLKTAEDIISMKPSEVRIYPVVILKNTELEKLYKSGEYKPYDFDTAVKLCAELLKKFEENGIKVIKLGLHASGMVEDELVGGLYHPAFRELCESENIKNELAALFEKSGKKSYTVSAAPSMTSKVIGQKKANIKYFKSIGIDVKVVTDPFQKETVKITDV